MVIKPKANFSIRSFVGGYDKNFTYVITCMQSRIQVCVDASINLKVLSPHIHDKITAVLITHSHKDHIAYLDQYKNSYPDLVVISHPDNPTLGMNKNVNSIQHDQSFRIGALNFRSLHTPGHYFDSICYLMESVLFTGDTIFVGRTGRVTSDRSSIEQLYKSVYDIILQLPQNVRIYPGHDYGKKPTLSLEENVRISNLLQATDLDDFKRKMEEYELNRKSSY